MKLTCCVARPYLWAFDYLPGEWSDVLPNIVATLPAETYMVDRLLVPHSDREDYYLGAVWRWGSPALKRRAARAARRHLLELLR